MPLTVFIRDELGGWSERAYVKASHTDDSDFFGESIALSEDTLAVGARLEDGAGTGVNPVPDNVAFSSGAVFVFQ